MAAAQKITAQDLFALKVIDGIIEEPMGGAHRNPEKTFTDVKAEIVKFFGEYDDDLGPLEIRELRREKFLAIGTSLT